MAFSDDFGRTITKTTDKGMDHYRVDDGAGNVFTLSYKEGHPWSRAQEVINTLVSIKPGETIDTVLEKFPNSVAFKSRQLTALESADLSVVKAGK